MLPAQKLLQMQANGVGTMGTPQHPEITKKALNSCFLRVKWALNARNSLIY